MDRLVYFNELYDCYQNLLTEKEKVTFEDYYKDNLSLQEIADNNQVSKSAVHKTIQNGEEKLENWEKILHLREKNLLLNKLLEYNDIEKIKKEIVKIIEL